MKEEIRKAAMLGTRQHPFQPPATGTPLDPLLSGLAGREPAQQLLDTVALLVTYEQAGPVPLAAPPLPEAAAEDPRPRSKPKHLAKILGDDIMGYKRTLLAEWLEWLAEAEKRPPEEAVPGLLEAATADPKLRAGVKKAVGPLGEWLANHNREWAWVLPSPPPAILWETGTLEQRGDALQQIRDRDRAEARRLLDAALPKENAEARIRLLALYSYPPVPEDEDWLEQKLAERGGMQRRLIVDRLSMLPASRLVERMKDRLDGRVTPNEVRPFEDLTEDMIRDGIERKPPQGMELGERSWWTMQAIATVPPSYWTEVFDRPPSELLLAARLSAWAGLLISAWQTAAIRFSDQEWLLLLLEQCTATHPRLAEMLQALDAPGRERAVLRLLRRDRDAWLHPKLYSWRWSLAFSKAWQEAAHRRLIQPDVPPVFPAAFRTAAYLASPDLEVTPYDMDWREFREILALRREMRDALFSDDGRKHGE